MKQSQPPPCPGCNGTGQMTSFGGVSRFQFSYTDCPECNGVGFLNQSPGDCLQPKDLANKTTLSTKKAEDFLKALAQTLSNTLLQGEKIQLRGFGSFCCSSSGSAPPGKIRFIPAKQLLQNLNTPKKWLLAVSSG
jgi:DnaJ-class molecular chaperone